MFTPMGRQSEKNDLKKTHAISYTLEIFSVDINYIVINWLDEFACCSAMKVSCFLSTLNDNFGDLIKSI